MKSTLETTRCQHESSKLTACTLESSGACMSRFIPPPTGHGVDVIYLIFVFCMCICTQKVASGVIAMSHRAEWLFGLPPCF